MSFELSTILNIMAERNGGQSPLHDWADEYGEPGYSSDGPILFGDWWCHCNHGPESDEARARENFRPLHDISYHYPRVFAFLEEEGCELEWYDEWMVSYASTPSKAFRTSADSYSWQSSILWDEESCEYLTPDDDPATIVDAVVNDPHKAIPRPMLTEHDLRALGWEEYACGYENGWFPGQNDNPEEITRLIHERHGQFADVVFYLSSVGQFDIGFCAFYRVKNDEENNEENDEESEG